MNKYDLVAIGDAVIDIFLTIDEKNGRVNFKDSELCFKYGTKIPVESAKFFLGGNACNVSVGLSRLGLKTAIFSEIGDDDFSDMIVKGLKTENVSEEYIKRKNGISSFSVGINYKGERTLFVEHVLRGNNFDFSNFYTEWVYLTSLGEAWKEAYKKTLDFVQNKNLKLAFNPGTLQLLEGYNSISDTLKKTDILFLNKEEAVKITSTKSADQIPTDRKEIEKLLTALQETGPKIVVITDGVNGSFCIDQDKKTYSHGIIDVKIMNKTGAGDAYTSGFISAIISGQTIEEAMNRGTLNATSVIGKIGAQVGLLKKTEMEEKLMTV
ncbi:MAG: carbohydrate kinase family protein [Patescibacteria group bacterium]|nr:carbohydrate kinase family protein [Patescibacteria group bacterium]